MVTECAFSFSDLYMAAYGKKPETDVMQKLEKMTQVERNKLVTKWAKKAKWETKLRIGSDNIEYVAFAPKFLGK